MTIHALLDSVKKLQVKIQTKVIELKDLKDDNVGNEDIREPSVLETEMQKIAMEKERRDRVECCKQNGFLFFESFFL